MTPLPENGEVGADTLLGRAARILPEALALLRERRALDFAGYRTGTLERRIANRMVSAHVTDGAAYIALLAGSDAEIDRLAANLTIKVSRFYRNASVFDFLGTSIVPYLRRQFGAPLKVWSAGCATGEEAWSLAMLLGEKDEVLATDIDEAALRKARAAEYPPDALAELPAPLGSAFVRPTAEDEVRVADHLRRRVLFSRHDLARASTAPDGRQFHLICCRNVLIYFAQPLQRTAMHLLTTSLVPGGVLCLGEAEWPSDELSSLEVVDRRLKVFRRRSEGTPG